MCKGDRKLTRTQWIVIGVGISIAVLVGAVTLILVFTLGKSNKNDSSILGDADAEGPLHVIDRSDWVAADMIDKTPLTRPIDKIIIFETGTETCYQKQNCIKVIRHIQDQQMNASKADISYNFLVDGEGEVYYGRGWDGQPDAENCKDNYLAIALISSKSSNPPNRNQVKSTKRLIRAGVQAKLISAKYTVAAASQVTKVSQGSGIGVESEVSKWPGYSDNIQLDC